MRYGTYLETLVGRLYIAEEDGCLVELGSGSPKPGDCLQETELLRKTAIQLQEYFAGNRREFEVPVCGKGTEFQSRVWKAGRLWRWIGCEGQAAGAGRGSVRN